MTALAHPSRLGQVLHRLPASWIAALDAWSYRVAQRNMERRKLATQPRPPATPIAYQLKPWRD
jgi:hypothetical protein